MEYSTNADAAAGGGSVDLSRAPRPKRKQTLSLKTLENLEHDREEHYRKLEKAWQKTEMCLSSVSSGVSPEAIQRGLTELKARYEKYQHLSERYCTFLARIDNGTACQERDAQRAIDRERDNLVQGSTLEAKQRLGQLLETPSVASNSSKRTVSSRRSMRSAYSNISSISSAAKARAEAEAAKIRSAYSKKEAQLQLERARMEEEEQMAATIARRKKTEWEINLQLLREEKEAAAAEAQAKALEMATDYGPIIDDVVGDLERTNGRTMEGQLLRNTAAENRDRIIAGTTLIRSNSYTSQPTRGLLQGDDPSRLDNDRQRFQTASRAPLVADSVPRQHEPHTFPTTTWPHPQGMGTSSNHQGHVSQVATGPDDRTFLDVAKFLVRRELVNSGLVQFDDQPGSYLSWKSSFKNAIENLDVTACEELDLLVKWLGAESSKHVKRLKSVHITNPSAGLKMAWERLDECYGSPEAIENALFGRLEEFPKVSNTDHRRLRELGDLLLEVETAKADPRLPGLCYLDTARGVNPIVEKLPYSIQDKWVAHGSRYKEEYKVAFPPFAIFSKFVRDIAKSKSDPSFLFGSSSSFNAPRFKGDKPPPRIPGNRMTIAVKKTAVQGVPGSTVTAAGNMSTGRDPSTGCPLHRKPHPLNKCRGFRLKTLDERKALLKDFQVCFRCCASTSHTSRDCGERIKCCVCGSDAHASALHPDPAEQRSSTSDLQHSGEESTNRSQPEVMTKCTKVCGGSVWGRSCSRICLVKVHPKDRPDLSYKMYAVLDDQSNRSLARPQFFEMFDIAGEVSPYTLRTCAGTVDTAGRRACGYVVESIDGQVRLSLPPLIECTQIPDDRSEIPTPEVAYHHAHLKKVAQLIPPLDTSAEILLLLGRDILQVHKVRKQVDGPSDAPFAMRLDLGWVVVGNVCVNGSRKPDRVSTFTTTLLDNGRPSNFVPCPNHVVVKERVTASLNTSSERAPPSTTAVYSDEWCDSVFRTSPEDDKLAMSIEDKRFVEIMDREFTKDENNSWVAPLPFRARRPRLPDNREQALSRFLTLLRAMDRKPDMKEHFFTFMANILANGHAELAPTREEGKETWYLPIFGVYHPKKPGQIRVVFDSSAKFQGISLNDVLLKGPNLVNSLLGVLLRFRKEPFAFMTDIQQMFYCFVVRVEDRDYLRFFWFRNNNPNDEVVEHRMRVHVFGNSPSPAVATYGLRRTASEGENEYGIDARRFVERDFYVDDGLKSLPTEEAAIDLLRRSKDMLAESNLRLHKIASNSVAVMKAFPSEEYAKGLKDLDLGIDTPPSQRSLGLCWDIKNDNFIFQVPLNEKPHTKRGLLSTVNSLYDPLGFVAPVTIRGRLLLRELSSLSGDWDAELPPNSEWECWRNSLQALENTRIPRTYTPMSLSQARRRELCIFSDASTKVVAAVAYLRLTGARGEHSVGFLLGKAKLAPKKEQTIPRLELCGAALAVELADVLVSELDIPFDAVKFYTDSKVVLGYICNETRRFYVYVANRVERIRKSSLPEQWNYVPSEHNPADVATRAIPADLLATTTWLTGPKFLHKDDADLDISQRSFELIDPGSDVEVRPAVTCFATELSSQPHLGAHRFERFSSWKGLIRSIANLQHVAQGFHSQTDVMPVPCRRWHVCHKSRTSKDLSAAEKLVFKTVQSEAFPRELTCIENGQVVPKASPLFKLSPYIDGDGVLRIGGRLRNAALDKNERHPIIVPRQHHIATLLVRHHHETIAHQGRHFTEGAIRAAGLWIVGAKNCIRSVIHGCVKCRRLRARPQEQIMSDLPKDRLSMDPPFSYVGLDVFGPWPVRTRRTRGGGASNNKRWAVLFTCMSIRAIHIEVVESMDSSSFINALRRFFSIRGPVKLLRSDRGTNFVGACKELNIDAAFFGQTDVGKYLQNQGCTWVFNPPHASHMGGAWERMIGVARRILDSMLLGKDKLTLTHDMLITLLAEVTAIVNNRPLVPVSTDPEHPAVLTPNMILTQKSGGDLPSVGMLECDVYRRQWKQVQSMANAFWIRWKREYLPTLHGRRIWQTPKQDVQEGDIVLLKDNTVERNEWPLGRITKTLRSNDGKVRKVEVKIYRKGTTKVFERPVHQIFLLLPCDREL